MPNQFQGKRDQSLRTDTRTDHRAKQLRQEMTPPERQLWSKLRRKQLGGFRFRRQHPIGPYVADFYCHKAALIVEVDSNYHASSKSTDAARDKFFRERGIETLRVTAGDIASNIDGVRSTILGLVRQRAAEHPHPSPPPHAGEGARDND